MLVKRTLPSASATWTHAQVVLVGDAVGVERVAALAVAVPHIDRDAGERRATFCQVEDGQLQGHRHALGGAAGAAEAGPDVAADDPALLQHVWAVGAVTGVRAGGLVRDLPHGSRRRRFGGRARPGGTRRAAEDVAPLPQAASPTTAAPSPSARSACRRLRRVATSNPRPWSVSSSPGRANRRPSYVLGWGWSLMLTVVSYLRDPWCRGTVMKQSQLPLCLCGFAVRDGEIRPQRPGAGGWPVGTRRGPWRWGRAWS